ncbi:uncharacterized protein LOC115311024 isoform X2 [Ixodes scapularis]|uniref:uncharacterized protein LOC115311024 isoform X2 n=1 Tax=Ixodes scapularis TaxID=6945 RepID=UPI001C3883FB|nr:uncharacterized protein LOC115311024 isoform X2 [Ixodes scapularis]
MQTRPILIYECYTNGSSVDPPDSVNITVLLDGTDPATSVASVILWSASKGTPNSYVTSNFQTHYDAARGVGVRTNSNIPSKNNTEGYKIYDVDFECTNAKILLREVCPFQCNMKLTREL